MLVQDYMTSPAITVRPTSTIRDALQLMRERGIRRFPVTTITGWLRGIVSERDLLHASVHPASAITIWELNHIIATMTVEEVMTYPVQIVKPDDALDVATRIMLEQKVGGLPVVDEDKTVVGVLTESDIFRAFLNRRNEP